MKIHLIDNGHLQQADILRTRINERIPAEYAADGLQLELCIDAGIGPAESFCITADNGWRITGADSCGLIFGIGKFLHTARWNETDFIPEPPQGVTAPACDFRALDCPSHFYNWYQMAPLDELERYLEDMMLWGYNTMYSSMGVVNMDRLDGPLFKKTAARFRSVFRTAKNLGMRTGLGLSPNQAERSAPHELDADLSFDLTLRGSLGRNLCLSKPAAMEHMRGVWRAQLEQYTDIGIDYVSTWPYDEGGCGCAGCRPWGRNKYCDGCIELAKEVHRYYPDAKIIVSTWAFDAPNDEGEYAGLYSRLTGDMSIADYLLVDAHGDFPRYPLEHEPIKPIVNFPEISMWGLAPWGGFGANPLPERFQRLWNSVSHLVKGGLPYSEGIYEDINKVQYIGYYWQPGRHWTDILTEYIRYEYSADVVPEVLELMRCIERNHTLVADEKLPDAAVMRRAAQLAAAVNDRLCDRARSAWRWRILYIRAVLDEKRYSHLLADTSDDPKKLLRFRFYSGDRLLDDAEAQALFLELQGYYHCVPHNGENHHTLPPAGGTKLDVVV